MMDVIKIKEDAVNITKENIKDFLSSIEKQSYISVGYITLTGVLLGFIDDFSGTNKTILIYGAIIIILASYNILGKRIVLHTDMSPIFHKKLSKTYEEYLDSRFKDLRNKYSNARNLLCIKSIINNTLFFMLIGFIISIYLTI